MYDPVSTIAWHDETLALPLFGAVNFAAVHRGALRRLGAIGGLDAARTDEIVTGTLERLRDAWRPAVDGARYPPHHLARLVHYWQAVPLLREVGPLR